eukprot:402648-Prymnesium_polylepis.1
MKRHNFISALRWIKMYSTCDDMSSDLGISYDTFYGRVVPTIFQMCRYVDFLDWELRMWDY